MSSRPLRAALAVLALLATTAGCGARWSDEQRAAVAARDRGVDGGNPPDATGVAASGSTASAAGSAASKGTGGSAVAAGGVAAGSAADATGGEARPCTAPSTAPGVTDEEIAVGSISSLSGPVPGLGASSAAAARAYVAHRNATGGVCGRKVVLREADDGTDIGRYRAVLSQLAPGVFGVVGGFALGDVGGTEVVRQHALPVVNVPGAEDVAALPTVFDINPRYDDEHAVIGKYRFLHDQGARKVSMTYLAVDQSRAEAQIQRRLMEAVGLQIVQVQELPISTLSFDSAARGVANSGADYLFFIGDASSNVSMARSMEGTGHDLAFAEYFTFAYGTDFIEAAGTASDGAMTWLRTLPNEEAGGNREMATFLEWMDRTASDDVRDVFAADSWAGAKAFFDGLEALPGPITREALVAQLGSVSTYDAGGMLGPIRLGPERTNGCFVGMRVQGGEWRRLAPATGFLCA